MGWWTDPATGVRRHTRTGAETMREHRVIKREDAEYRNARTPDRNRKAVRRVMEGGSLTAEWERMQAGAVAVSRKGMRRKRKTRTDVEAAKQIRDLAQAAGEGFEVFAHGGDTFTIQHKIQPGIPEQLTARQIDVYDILGEI